MILQAVTRMPFRACGEGRLKGILRLRMLLRFASQDAPLRMVVWKRTRLRTDNRELS
jgi:hypothetical protein